MPAPRVEISVLGPVRVEGLAEPFRRSAALDLVVYLTFHPEGVRHADWPVALWPDRAISLPTVHSTASDARRALGLAQDGTPHLPRGTSLRLGPAVSSDVERLERLASSRDPGVLAEAVLLVRGPLFAGLRRVDWTILEGIGPRVEELVVDTALRAASEEIRAGRPTNAESLIRRALLVSPFDERLYRALLRATHAHGNRARLRGTMAQLVRLAGVAEPSWTGGTFRRDAAASLDALHPATAAVYRDLLTRAPATGAHPTRQ
jgi:DNA-binding SARP family transcriptional activator